MTILEETKDRMKAAKENGYKYLTYTYSTLREAQENKEAWTVAHGDSTANWLEWDIIPEEQLYTCCIYDLDAEDGSKVCSVRYGSDPTTARNNALLQFFNGLLGDTIDHWLEYNIATDAAKTGLQPTGESLKNWLAEKNLSQNKAAELCSVTPRTFRRWVAGSPPIPKGMWELLKIKAGER